MIKVYGLKNDAVQGVNIKYQDMAEKIANHLCEFRKLKQANEIAYGVSIVRIAED